VRVPGEQQGGLTSQAAAELGLERGVPVAASLIDAHAGALGTLAVPGSNVPLTRRLAVIAGTSACHLAVTETDLRLQGVWGPYFEALMPSTWLLEAGISASGAFLDHALASHPAWQPSIGFAEIEAGLDRLTPDEATRIAADLHLQPNVLGNRAPLADPLLKGGVAGWTLRDDADDLGRWYVAALQALAYATRHILGTFTDAGAAIDLLVASGGSAASERWCATHADALGIPVAVPAERDGVLLGSAMLGATAAGICPTLADAMRAMTRPGRIIEPRVEYAAYHSAKYDVYRRMIDDARAYDAIMGGAEP
jgi:FGGY-family pentulose kinase